MALAVYFAPGAMNAAQYDDVTKRLEAAGAGKPKGRAYHACFGEGDSLQVFDVFDSMADFEAFGAVLMPLLAEVGLDTGEPQIAEIHNIIVG